MIEASLSNKDCELATKALVQWKSSVDKNEVKAEDSSKMSSLEDWLRRDVLLAFKSAVDADESDKVLKLSLCLGELGGVSGQEGVSAYTSYLARQLAAEAEETFTANLINNPTKLSTGAVYVDQLSDLFNRTAELLVQVRRYGSSILFF